MAKKAKKEPKLKTWEEADFALACYREECRNAELLTGGLEDVLVKVRESYAAEIAASTASAEKLAADLSEFAEAHKSEFVAKDKGGEGRTRAVNGVEIGYRWGTPYVSIAKKHLESAVAGLDEIAEGMYVKRSPQLMREVLKAHLLEAKEKGDDASNAFIAKMTALHITLDQDEEFVLEVVKTQ